MRNLLTNLIDVLKISKLYSVMSTVMIALVLITSVVYAATIVVNGNPDDWPGNPTCTIGNAGCALLSNDPAESSSTDMPAAADVRTLWATNSATDAFFRFDTEASTDYSNSEFVRICLDIPSQSPGQPGVGGCGGISADRLIVVTDFGSGPAARVYNCNVVNCNSLFATPIATVSFNQIGTVNEIGTSLANLGITGTDDGSNISLVAFFDNNSEPPDDSIPDAAPPLTWPIGTGSPTAINLQSLSGNSGSMPWAIAILSVALLMLGIATIYFYHNQRNHLG